MSGISGRSDKGRYRGGLHHSCTQQALNDTSGLICTQKVILEEGQSDTRLPLAVLVNHNSASASEILAGALRDNHRAVILGDQTFGKGKIQSVFELGDGSALFVTVAR